MLGPRSFRLTVRESTYRLCLDCLAVPTSSVVVAAVVSRTLARCSRQWMHPCCVAPLPPPGLSAFSPRPELVPTVPSSCPRKRSPEHGEARPAAGVDRQGFSESDISMLLPPVTDATEHSRPCRR